MKLCSNVKDRKSLLNSVLLLVIPSVLLVVTQKVDCLLMQYLRDYRWKSTLGVLVSSFLSMIIAAVAPPGEIPKIVR